MEALKVENLSKDFGGVHAVKHISFTVEAGEMLAIIGPNGAGKTTLFNLLNGQYKPNSGSIRFFGQNITRLSTHRRAALGQARSFQVTRLFQGLTVMDNVFLAAQGTKLSRFQLFRPSNSFTFAQDKARDILKTMELWEKRDEIVRHLSYGEQRILEISLTLASDPRMLLLDEPTCGLSSKEWDDMMTLIRRLGEDTTVIMVAHDMDLVFGLARRIIVLHYGEIIADGTSQEIQEDPRVQEIYMGVEE